MNQGAAQAQLLFHPPGELAGEPLGEGGQPDRLQQRRPPLPQVVGRHAEQSREAIDAFAHREAGVEVAAEALRQIGQARAHPPARRRIGHVGAEHLQLSALQPPRAGDQGQQARLADAIGSDQPQEAAGRQLQIDAGEGRDGAVAQPQSGGLQGEAHGAGGSFTCSLRGQGTAGSSRTQATPGMPILAPRS